MLLRDLTIENFRSFDKYQLNGLARVNLLVGDNNCGKTSVLEAAYLLNSRGDLGAVCGVLDLREDIQLDAPSKEYSSRQRYNSKSLFFRSSGSSEECSHSWFRLTAEASEDAKQPDRLQELLGELDLEPDATRPDNGVPSEIARTPHLTLRYSLDANGRTEFVQTDRRGTYSPPWAGYGGQLRREYEPLIFTAPGSMGTQGWIELWKRVYKERRDRIVTQAMQVISPEFHGIPIVISTGQFRAEILVDRGNDRRYLSEMGDGLVNMMEVGAVMAYCASGTCLIDEIDTGLHYSRLKDMWRMVIKAAQELDVQVFATTHSLDCIRGLADAVQQDESLTGDIALFRIDRRSDEAVRFGGEELPVVAGHEIEVR